MVIFGRFFSGASNTVPQQSARRRPFLDALDMNDRKPLIDVPAKLSHTIKA